MDNEMTRAEEITSSIVRKFRKPIWCKFLEGIKTYEMIKENDRIAVCISGGKDSMLMAMCIKQLSKYTKIPFTAEFLVMDPGYAPANRKKIEDNAALLNIPLTFFESTIFDAANASSYARPTTSGRPIPKNPSLTFLSIFGSSFASTSFLSSSSAGRPAKTRS